jgi:hypothetical protein
MAGACLVSDEQSLSPGDGDTERQPGGGDEVVFGLVHSAIQSTTQTLRAFVQRTIQGAGGGRERRGAEDDREYRRIRRGWCLGEEAFRKELLGQMAGRAGENHYAEERQESDGEKARRIVVAELKRLNWTEPELRRRRKGDPKKVKMARRLREETTMTLKWIAGELHMGAWTHVSNLLSQSSRGEK